LSVDFLVFLLSLVIAEFPELVLYIHHDHDHNHDDDDHHIECRGQLGSKPAA
jgi:hypothetical protein